METDDNHSDRQRASGLESIKTKNVRTITDLREILGFGKGEFDQSRVFKKTIKQFASEFIAEDGNPGPMFTRWSDSFHKSVFSDMANVFLEKHGRELWPDSPITQRLQYERDHAHESNQPSSVPNGVPRALETPPDDPNLQPNSPIHAQTEDGLPMEDIHHEFNAIGVPESFHAIDSSRCDGSDDPFDGPPEGSGRRFDCDTEHTARQRSRSFTMGIMPDLGEESLPEPDFPPEDEPNLELQASPERVQTPYQKEEEQPRVEIERCQFHQGDLDSVANECRAATSTDNGTAPTNAFNIDYTVYNDEEEPLSSWTPPRYFFSMSFDELVRALPLKRPRGLRLCLEGAVKRKGFSRTACDQERFRLHQSRFEEMMRSWEDEIASRGGPRPSFEIIIEPLK
ncbi:hypothetical protein N0V84_008890 [Fusarium piperis]|uniref:Uncharacterized protein n=1 Tax=Fusarium piperis TaxID=1435070 RepID=A0A9W8W792_9HYPO|nr:hypothetical protein N0V84_008890 [Fusarium piperis]